MGMRSEHLKVYLRGATREKESETRRWGKLVSLTKMEFQEGPISTSLAWTSMVLIPKGGGYYKWIGLVECIWKVYASIMNNRLRASITLHYDSHGFRQVMEAGTATMEENWPISSREWFMNQFSGFTRCKKTYNSLDIGLCMDILRGMASV